MKTERCKSCGLVFVYDGPTRYKCDRCIATGPRFPMVWDHRSQQPTYATQESPTHRSQSVGRLRRVRAIDSLGGEA